MQSDPVEMAAGGVFLMDLTSQTCQCCVCCGPGRFRWQLWHGATSAVIHRTSAFQEQHSTHGRLEQRRSELGAVNKSRSHLSGVSVHEGERRDASVLEYTSESL